MQVRLTKPELEKFVDEKVKRGDFSSPDAVVEDAVARMMREEQDITDEDIDALNAAEDEMDRGQHVDFEQFAERMRKKHAAQ